MVTIPTIMKHLDIIRLKIVLNVILNIALNAAQTTHMNVRNANMGITSLIVLINA